VDETGVPTENNRPAACHWQTLSHYCIVHYHAVSRFGGFINLIYWQYLFWRFY